MASFNHISGAEPSTITFKAATVVQTRNSSVMHQELISLADPESSLGVCAVLGAAPASTTFGLVVRTVGDSTVVQGGAPWSIKGDSTVFQGGGAWSIKGDSTVFQGGGAWSVKGDSTVFQGGGAWSIKGDSTVFQGGSPWAVSIGTNLQSSAAPSSNSSGIIVRQVIDAILTVASSNAFASTSLVIQSSGAGLRSYVVAYSMTSTAQAPTKVSFFSSGTMTWPVVLAALSSAVTGVNLAVSAPAYLFRTAAAEALTLQVNSSVAGFKVGVSYFRAP